MVGSEEMLNPVLLIQCPKHIDSDSRIIGTFELCYIYYHKHSDPDIGIVGIFFIPVIYYHKHSDCDSRTRGHF